MLSRFSRRCYCTSVDRPWLFVGLGNPGDKYKGTRHNIGFDMIDVFAESVGIEMNLVNFKAIMGQGFIGDLPVILAKPQTYMNLSEVRVPSVLAYLDGPLPEEPAVTVLKNIIPSVNSEIWLVGESECVPVIVKLLESKSNGCREAVAQAIAELVTEGIIHRELKKEGKSNLLMLLESNPGNTVKKYAMAGLLGLSGCEKSKKMMVSYGAIGYMKKLSEMKVTVADKLLLLFRFIIRHRTEAITASLMANLLFWFLHHCLCLH